MISQQAKFSEEIMVIDPDTKSEVEISIFKHENGGMFGIDSSYIVQVFDDDEVITIPDPLNANGHVILFGV